MSEAVIEEKYSRAKKRLDVSMNAVIDNIVFSKRNQVAYYRLAGTPYDFLSGDAKIQCALRTVQAFANLMSDRNEPLDCHLFITSNPLDVNAWKGQLLDFTANLNRAPGFDRILKQQENILRKQEYSDKVVYLGVDLGRRGALDVNFSNFFEAGAKSTWESIVEWTKKIAVLPDLEVSEEEEKIARQREKAIFRTLSTGNLRATRCTAEEILLVTKREFYPYMPTPYLEVDHENRIGAGDIDLELSGEILKRGRWLKMTHMIENQEYVGYRATLTLAKLPRTMVYPYRSFPFLYYSFFAGYPFNVWSRFTLIPNSKMKKDLEKKKKEQRDELENLSTGATALESAVSGIPSSTLDALEDQQELSRLLAEDKMPWVKGKYHMVVDAGSEDELKTICSTVKQDFADMDINVQWTVGDQVSLLLESLPGDRVRNKGYSHITDLNYLGSAGATYSSDVGDAIRPHGPSGG